MAMGRVPAGIDRGRISMKAAGMAAATGIAMSAAADVDMEKATAEAMAAIATDSRMPQRRWAPAAQPTNALPVSGRAFLFARLRMDRVPLLI